MKMFFAVLLAVGFGVGATHATSEVLSVNAVGYVKVVIPPNGLNIISTPFVDMNGDEPTLDDLFGSEVPAGSIVHIWDSISNTYTTVDYLAFLGGWYMGNDEVGSMVIGRGVGLWFENSTSQELELFVMGQVPSAQQDVTIVPLSEGLSLVTFSYPVEINISESGLNAQTGDIIHVWTTEDGGKYATIDYLHFAGGWTEDIVIRPGQAFWYETSQGKDWAQTKPYDWP